MGNRLMRGGNSNLAAKENNVHCAKRPGRFDQKSEAEKLSESIPEIIDRVLGKGHKVSHLADRKGSVSESALSYQFKKAMTAKVRTNVYPAGSLY